jgi:hypothetical protein
MATAETGQGNDMREQTLQKQESENVKTAERPRFAFGAETPAAEHARVVSVRAVSRGSMMEAVGGIVAMSLGILALATVAPTTLPAIAAIAIGVGLLFEGGALAAQYRRLPEEVKSGRWASIELSEGMIGLFAGGIAGASLGVLSVIGLASAVLTPIAVLVFGIALLMGSGVTARMNYLESGRRSGETMPKPHRYHRATWVATGIQILFGLAACALGVLALVGIAPLLLSTIAFLALGVACFLSGVAVSGRVLTVLRG